MPMSWRRLTIASTAALLLAAGIATAVHLLVDPQKLKDIAQAKARAAWGRDVQVGDVALNLLPWPSVRATKVAFAAPPWARSRNVLEVDQVDANLELVPLFVGKVRVKTLSLEGVKAALEEADDGAENWSRGGTEASEGAKAPVEGPLAIGSIHLRNVVVHRRVGSVDSAPWLIEEASADVEPGLRNVHVEAKVKRHDQPLAVSARFADLSHLGEAGAVTDGRVELAFARTRATLEGRLPLERSLQGHALHAEASSKSLEDVFAFMGFERGATAPFALSFTSRGTGEVAELQAIAMTLGELKVQGELRVAIGKDSRRITGRLASNRIDWLKTLQQSGGKVKPPRHDGEVFHADPVAWRAISFLGAIDAPQLDLAVESLRLGNGLQLENVKARAKLGGGAVEFAPFSAAMLGGSGSGTLRLDAPKKSIRFAFDGDKLSLEQWFEQRGRKIPFKDGPMTVKASLAMGGETFRELAASVTGPVTLRMGRGTWLSAKAGEMEEMMVSALAAKGASDLHFECAAAKLDFKRGRASGGRVLGARTDVSQLLTGGAIDFRDETVDLHGRVQARKGITLGLATLAGGVRISGKVARPRIGMDPDEKPALLARAAAAVATAGASIVGETLLTAAARDDPCEAVFK